MPDGAGQQGSEGTPSLSRMWGALAYEIKMYFTMRATHGNPSTPLLLSSFIGNAIAESAILHARILCDLFSSESKRWEDDIGFSDLFDDWETAGEEVYSNLRGHIAEMKIAYGDYKTENSPCWQFNKMLAHLTKERGFRHIYEDALRKVEPFIRNIVSELEGLKPGFLEHAM